MMADTIYLTFLIIGLFSILLGTLGALIPRKLTSWEEKLCLKLRLISESKCSKPAEREKFVLERLLGCVLLAFGIMVIYCLPIQLSLQLGEQTVFTLDLGQNTGAADWQQAQDIPEDSAPAQGLHILIAQYGTGNIWRDISKQLRNKIRDNAISIRVTNDIAGDPILGKPKRLRIIYALDGERKTAEVQEGQWLYIPSDIERNPQVKAVRTNEELIALVKQCPAEVGLFGRNLSTGESVEYRPDQPACLASIVKIFVLLEVAKQAEDGTLEMTESITIERNNEKQICTISEALDKMIGVSDNEATDALAARVGWQRINTLPGELGISGLSDKILPEPGGLADVLDKRVFGKSRLCPVDNLLGQHGSARGIVQYFELLNAGKLINKNVSKRVLEVFDRNPKSFAAGDMPTDFKSVGKGGSLTWIRPDRPQYNMLGWGLLVKDKQNAVALCLWFEWFDEQTSEELKRKWCTAISESIVYILLGQEPKVSPQKQGAI